MVDGENRLISMTMTNTVAGITNSNRLKLDFAYDFMGRWIQKIVSTNSGSAFVPQSTNRFVYDGWNLVAILNPQSSILASFAWGNDLSRTMTRAGGVGGLLMANFSGTNCFAAYDGNGNITALVNAADKSLAARYEYSPYGELIRATGLLARQNPFRFSTKFWDDESGLVYYGYRYYSPNQSRWIGRDPTTDQVLLQLFLFCHNNPVTRFDIDGREDATLLSILAANLEGLWIEAQMSAQLIIDAFEVGESVGAVADTVMDVTIYMANSASIAAWKHRLSSVSQR